jgi:hypothetical protein
MSALLQLRIKSDFGPEQTRVMGEAFDVVCEYLKHSGREGLDTAEMRDFAAHKIIEKAACGEASPLVLANYAITLLRM